MTFLDPLLGRSGYHYECTKQEVKAGCGLVMGAGSDARVSLLLHFTKLTAHLFDLLLPCSEFNIDARLSSRSARRDGGNRNRLAQNSSRSISLFFFSISTKSIFYKMPPFKFYSILNSATENDHASKSWRYLER